MRLKRSRLFLLTCFIAANCATPRSIFAAQGFLGVQMMEDAKGGVSVARVVEGGPAEKAGIKAGDIVTAMGDEPVANTKELVLMLKAASPGDDIKFKIKRGDADREIAVKLGKRPPPPAKAEGLLNVKAPELDISQWHNLPEGKKQLKLADFKDKTVFLYCFQSW